MLAGDTNIPYVVNVVVFPNGCQVRFMVVSRFLKVWIMDSEDQGVSIKQFSIQRLNRLLEMLSDRGHSQTQVAARAGIPAQYLSDIKHGRRPMTELVARRLGEEFDVNFQWLLGTSDSMENPSPLSSAFSSGSSVWLPLFSHPIKGEPRAQSTWDGTGVEVAGAASAKLILSKLPYVLRFGRDDVRGRLRKGDLILISQAADVDAEISVVRYRKKLFLARRGETGNWIRVGNGNELPAECPVSGHCVGVVWSPL